MANAPVVTDGKPDIQAALDNAGIDYAKTWNREQLIDAYNVANPAAVRSEKDDDDDGQIHMSFGPISTQFMVDAGYDAERVSDAGRGWFTIDPDKADSLVERLDMEIEELESSEENGSNATARKLSRMRERIVDRLSKLEG